MAPGDGLQVTWAGVPNPTGADMIALYPAGASPTAYIAYVYTNGTVVRGDSGAASGEVSMVVPLDGAPGTYELRYLPNETYDVIATSNSFTVR